MKVFIYCLIGKDGLAAAIFRDQASVADFYNRYRRRGPIFARSV